MLILDNNDSRKGELKAPCDNDGSHNSFFPDNILYKYILLALTRKICGISSKKLQKLALLKLLSNLSVKTTVFCYFLISHKFYRFRLVVDINIIT